MDPTSTGNQTTDQINAAFLAAQQAAAAAGTTVPAGQTGSGAAEDQLSSDVNFFLTMLTPSCRTRIRPRRWIPTPSPSRSRLIRACNSR
jgi:hypothetical protein